MNTTRQKMKMPRWVKQQLAADVCILRSYATRAASDSHTHSSFGDLGGPTCTMQLRHGTAARRALLTSATICGGPRSRARVSRAHATQRNWHASMDTESPDGYHRDPGLIRVPIHVLVPLKLKYPYMSASKREAAVRLLRVGKRLSESAD